jgi:hypothetical protein
MNAYLLKYTYAPDDRLGAVWKIAKSSNDAFKFAFGRTRSKDNVTVTKKGLKITLIEIEEHEVSKAFPISSIPKRTPTKEMSNSKEWML